MATKSKLVQRIIGILKLDDGGRVEAFFSREVKNLARNVKALQSNRKTIELQHDVYCDDYKDKLQDMTDAVDAAKEMIDVSQLHSNASMEEFRQVYWGKVEAAENRLEKQIAAFKKYSEDHEKELAEIDKTITKLKARIAEIQA